MNEEYKDLESIKNAFGNDKIRVADTQEELFEYLKNIRQHTEGETVFFRGQSEAKWICRSSLLRRCLIIKNEDSEVADSFKELRAASRNMWKTILGPNFSRDAILSSYQKCNKLSRDQVDKMTDEIINTVRPHVEAEYNAQWREVLAQHFGLPTALIDFSKDLDVALYFATKGKNQDAISHKDIDQYCSVIVIKGNQNNLVNWEKTRENGIKDFKEILESGLQVCDEAGNMLEAAEIDMSPVIWGWDAQDDTSALDDFETLSYIDQNGQRLISNRRIEKQRGILLCLGCNGHDSLEDAIRHLPEGSRPYLACLLINKKLVPTVSKHLDEKGIDDKAMGLLKAI